MNFFQTSVTTRKSAVGSSLQSKLLVSAAATALLFVSALPAEAGCAFVAFPNSWVCSSPPVLTATDFSGWTINPSLDLTFDATAHLTTNVTIGQGPFPGPLTFTTKAGAVQDAATDLHFTGIQTNSATTAVVDNAGTLNGGLHLTNFGGLVTVTNEASGTINNLDLGFNAVGSTVWNKAGGTIGTVYQDACPHQVQAHE